MDWKAKNSQTELGCQGSRLVANKFVQQAHYCIFYSILALLIHEGINPKTSKHSGILALFDKDFVRTGKFLPPLSKVPRALFELRLEFDYKEYSEPTLEKAEEALNSARKFLFAVKEYVGKD